MSVDISRLVQILAKTLQATTATESNWTYDQSWLVIMCTSPSIHKRHVAIARLKNPCNFGRHCQEARFIVFILSPMKEKGTKNFLETGRTFATIFADIELRAKLLKASTQQEFISIIDVSRFTYPYLFICNAFFSVHIAFKRNIRTNLWNSKHL
jgi:solute carrier family 4 (sodium borate transporter), member 11